VDTAFFWLSKLVWSVIAPESLMVLLVLAAWVLLLRGATKWAKRVLGPVAVTLLILSFLPVGEWVLYPLEARFAANPALPQKVDGIIVLGGAEDAVRSAAWGQVEVNDSAERFLASVALSRRYPQAKLVFTSGSGSVMDQAHKGAAVAKKLYEELGLEASRTVLEGESRNTAENVLLSKALVKPAAGENWILVTSAFHMPRSVGIFCKAGWPVIAFPVDHRTVPGHQLRADAAILGNLSNLSLAIKEYVGLVAYYLSGRTSTLFPATCNE
jgi:uncharacterized SAM-binding protein YcdF (DUF218 family)